MISFLSETEKRSRNRNDVMPSNMRWAWIALSSRARRSPGMSFSVVSFEGWKWILPANVLLRLVLHWQKEDLIHVITSFKSYQVFMCIYTSACPLVCRVSFYRAMISVLVFVSVSCSLSLHSMSSFVSISLSEKGKDSPTSCLPSCCLSLFFLPL